MKTKNPVTGSDRVPDIKALGRALDTKEPNPSASDFQAAQRIASRFRISMPHARVVCELAGIGGVACR